MSSPKTELRKQPQQARSRALVDAIIEATQRIMASEGVAALTTAGVAELAGVSVGSLYQYFPGREALIAAVVDRKIAADREQALAQVEALRELDLDEAIRGLVELVVRYYRDETPLYREMVAALAEAEREAEVRALTEGLDRAILLILARHRDALPVQLEPRAWVMRTLCIACVREAAAQPDKTPTLASGALSRQLEDACRGLLGLPPLPKHER